MKLSDHENVLFVCPFCSNFVADVGHDKTFEHNNKSSFTANSLYQCSQTMMCLHPESEGPINHLDFLLPRETVCEEAQPRTLFSGQSLKPQMNPSGLSLSHGTHGTSSQDTKFHCDAKTQHFLEANSFPHFCLSFFSLLLS